MYLDVSSSDSEVKAVDFGGSVVDTSLDVGTEVEMKSFLTTFVGGYRIVETPILETHLVAGARFMWLESRVNWDLAADVSGPVAGRTFARRGSLTEDGEIWNGIGGVRGNIRLGNSRWLIPYYADAGAGDCDLTWQVFAGLAYSFESWDIILGYRHLAFESEGDALIRELSISGPILGARFEF